MGALTLALGLALGVLPQAAPADCGAWHRARLTSYQSYPAQGSEECVAYNGCAWAGQFYGLPAVHTEDWVAAHDIVAVHLKDWDWLGLKTLELRQEGRSITAQVLDACSDEDCEGCCTANLGGDGYLIDMESYTARRFGASDGIVEFRVCE